MQTISKPQEIQFQRLRLINYNDFDGEQVADALQANSKLWKSFVVGRFHYRTLIELRDLHHDFINADTIFALVPVLHKDAFADLAKKLGADEISWIYLGKDNKPVIEGDRTIREEYMWDLGGDYEGVALFRLWWD